MKINLDTEKHNLPNKDQLKRHELNNNHFKEVLNDFGITMVTKHSIYQPFLSCYSDSLI